MPFFFFFWIGSTVRGMDKFDCFPKRGSHRVWSRALLQRIPRVIDSQDCLTLTGNTSRSSTPSRESILGEVLVPTLTKYTPRESVLRNHRLGSRQDTQSHGFKRLFDAYGKYFPVINSIWRIYSERGSRIDPYEVSTSGIHTTQPSFLVGQRFNVLKGP
jgi:hypothetical protein